MRENNLTVEASSLGLPPGRWPSSVQCHGRLYRQSSIETDNDGDVTHAIYLSDEGFQLIVLND